MSSRGGRSYKDCNRDINTNLHLHLKDGGLAARRHTNTLAGGSGCGDVTVCREGKEGRRRKTGVRDEVREVGKVVGLREEDGRKEEEERNKEVRGEGVSSLGLLRWDTPSSHPFTRRRLPLQTRHASSP